LARQSAASEFVAIASGDDLPLAASVESAWPAESQFVESILTECFLDESPQRPTGDKAYDSDALDKTLAEEYGVDLISPDRANGGKP
jgi:hypothetical protein